MKIAFLHHTFIAGSGIDGVVYEMARRLGKRHQVMVMTMRTDGSYRDVPVMVFPSQLNGKMDAVFAPLYVSAREIRRELASYDIVCTQLYPASVIPLFPTKLPIKHVLTEWGVQNIGGGLANRVYTGLLKRMEDYTVRKADVVLAGCEYTRRKSKRKDAVTLYQYGIDFDHLNHDHYGMYERDRLSAEHPVIGRHDRVLLFVGRNSPHKHIDILIDALKLIPDKAVKLVVVGRQDFVKNQWLLEAKVEELSLADRVLFTGVVSSQEVVDWYCRCEMFVNASEWEGFLIPEAFALSKPIVAYDTEAHREVIRSGRGTLVPELTGTAFAIAVTELLDNPWKAQRLGGNGYVWAKQNLDYDRIVENWERVVL